MLRANFKSLLNCQVCGLHDADQFCKPPDPAGPSKQRKETPAEKWRPKHLPVGHEIQLCNASGQNLHLCPARDMWATCTLHSKGTCDPNAQGTATLLGGNKAKSTDSLAESGCFFFKLFLHQGTLILTVPTLIAQRICSGFTRRGTWHS